MSPFDWIKNTLSVLKEAGKIKEYEKILSLANENEDIKKKLSEAEQKIATLEGEINQKRKLEYRNESYWDGDDGPFCSRCFDELDKPIRIHPVFIGSNFSICPKCNTRVNVTGRQDFIPRDTNDPKNSAR